MIKTLGELVEAMSQVADGGTHPDFVDVPAAYLGRMTKSMTKDKIQFARIGEALGAPDISQLRLCDLDAAAVPKVEDFLARKGLPAAGNTMIKARFVRELAVVLKQAEATPIVPVKPKREKLSKRDENGKRVRTHPKLREIVPPYRAHKDRMPAELRAELDKLQRFCQAIVVRGRRGRARRDTTWAADEERLERFFGALEKMDYPLESASLKDVIDIEKIDAYTKFFITIHGEPTYTLKDFYALFQYVAANYFRDREAADDIGIIIAQTKFVRRKDYDHLVQHITADDLYHLGDMLFDHALAYKEEWHGRKPCKAVRYPHAMIAFHLGRALAYHLALATWLRRSNLFEIVYGQHLYKRGEELFFRFTAVEMKGDRDHVGQVRDLWRGEPALRRLKDLLALYEEYRPSLVARYLAAHPGAKEPKELLLNKRGMPYGPTGAYGLFRDLSAAYLGADKAINPHAVRHVLPSYVLKEYGYDLLGEVQSMLAHSSVATTTGIYARTNRLWSAEKAQRRIDRQRDIEEMAARIKVMEQKLDRALAGGDQDARQEDRAEIAALKAMIAASGD